MAGFQAQWAIDEFAGIDLNDNRLNTRAITIATQLGTIGESSPQKKKKKRDSLPIEQKESYHWLQMTRRGMQIARENPGTEYVGVSDSESDIGELLSESVLRPNNYHVILRACQNRALAKATCTEEATSTEEIRLARNIQQKLDQCAVRFTSSTQVRGRTAKTKVEHRSRQQSRDDRMADLEVRATTITLPVNLAATSDVTGRLVPSVITLNVVEVREPNPPEGEVAIHWILLTTLPIDTDEQVAEIVAAYKVRWKIEVFL